MHLVLIDVSAFIHRAFHAMPPFTTSDGRNVGALLGFAQTMFRLRTDGPLSTATHAVAVLDGGSAARKALHPAYKANRGPKPDALREQLDGVRDVIEAFDLNWLHVADEEADDVIATLAKGAVEWTSGRVTILSTDKDLMQLVGDRVRLFDAFTGRAIDEEAVVAKFGVPPRLVGDALALIGDASDNIPGLPKVGPKRAADLLKSFGSLAGILAAVDDPFATITPASLRQTLVDYRDQLPLSRALVELRDIDLSGIDVSECVVGDIDHNRILEWCETVESVAFADAVRAHRDGTREAA